MRQQRLVEHDAAGDADVADDEQHQRQLPVAARIQNIAVVAMTPIATKMPSSFFFIPAKSAMAPSSGATSATMTMAMVVAHANRLVDRLSPRSAATTLWK